MGADFMFSINEMEVSREMAHNNIEAFLAYPEKLLAQLSLHVPYLYNETPTVDGLRTYLRKCVDDVYACETRDEGFFHIDGTRRFHITGGTSAGDSPSVVWDSYCVCEVLGLTRRRPYYHIWTGVVSSDSSSPVPPHRDERGQ